VSPSSSLLGARRFEFPRSLAEECTRKLQAHGEQGAELFIALTAIVDQDERSVCFRRALVPEQTCYRSPEGLYVKIDGEAIFALNRDVFDHGELLAGQIHAHPGRAYHSPADDALALIRLPGGLSIVVPHFARGPLRSRRWSVHQLRGDGAWARKPRRVRLKVR
jgi:hypothetical protein